MSAIKRIEEKLNEIVVINKTDVLIITGDTAWRVAHGYDSKDAENIKERFITKLVHELEECW